MEIPELNKYFEEIVEINDARLKNHMYKCNVSSVDCTRSIRLLRQVINQRIRIS